MFECDDCFLDTLELNILHLLYFSKKTKKKTISEYFQNHWTFVNQFFSSLWIGVKYEIRSQLEVFVYNYYIFILTRFTSNTTFSYEFYACLLSVTWKYLNVFAMEKSQIESWGVSHRRQFPLKRNMQ